MTETILFFGFSPTPSKISARTARHSSPQTPPAAPSEFRISPRHTARILGGQNPERKNTLSFFKKKSTLAKSEMQGVFFLSGLSPSPRGGGGAIRRAYDLGQSHHALRAWHIICFENRCELGKIETPHWKSQGFRCRLASLGDQIVWIFRGKKKYPIPLEAEKKNFHKILSKERHLPLLDFYGLIC